MSLKYDAIVVGSSLEAVIFAFNNDYPVFFTRPERPFRFDYLDPIVDLSCLKIPLEEKTLTTFDGEMKVGITKELLWERLLFLLSLRGKVPLSNFCSSMRWDGKNIICSSEYNRILNVSFDVCYFFELRIRSCLGLWLGWDFPSKHVRHDYSFFEFCLFIRYVATCERSLRQHL